MDFQSLDSRTAATAVLATTAAIATLSAVFIVHDYNQWVSFGTGGTPPTPAGYRKMTKFRWKMFWNRDDLRDPSPLSDDGKKYLTRGLPQRQGTRPQIVARTMPQRQKPEPLDAAVRERLHNLPKKFCKEYPKSLELDLSKTEGRSTDAIYAKPDLPGRDSSAKGKNGGVSIHELSSQ